VHAMLRYGVVFVWLLLYSNNSDSTHLDSKVVVESPLNVSPV